MIDLIIVAAAAGGYLYLQSQGVIGMAAKSAKFTITDLTINPEQAYAGDGVEIAVNLTNIGALAGTKAVPFEINNVVKITENVTLAANSSQIVQYTDVETVAGNYTAQAGTLLGNFTVEPAPPESSSIVLSNLITNPYEVWANQTVTVTATAQNPSTTSAAITAKITVDSTVVQTQIVTMNASSTQTLEFNITAPAGQGLHTVKLNTLTTQISVVQTGYHTLEVTWNGAGVSTTTLTFIMNGTNYDAPFDQLMPVGQYGITFPNPFTISTGVLAFSGWSNGESTPSITANLRNDQLILFATYVLTSGYASCPSLFVWNGTGYSYVTDVCNAGWLGYMGTITHNGTITYTGGNPWDYVKLDKNMLAVENIDGNNYYDLKLAQQWDELFYLDCAYMLVVDHPAGTNVLTSMSNYGNPAFNDQIYTINQTNVLTPLSATYVWGPAGTTSKGINVLPEISKLDGVFTPGNNGLLSPSWNDPYLNQLTLNLGDLSYAKQIKLVLNGIVDWGDPRFYYSWVNQFTTAAAKGLIPANGTQIYPAPSIEVKDAAGNWIPVTLSEMPTPSDYNSRNFTVDLTGIFPKGVTDDEIRINNFFNVTFDYIGIDVSTQQNITVQKINPIATLSQYFSSNSTSSGNFTRYGDVTTLLQSADNMYVIGRQGDEVNMEFPTANLTAPAPGMVRDYFLIVACWFKDPPGNWGYGFNYTVNPLPFIGMSGFPYPSNESYPYDASHLAYLAEYNTRRIPAP
jgi:hypothetical protein